MGRAVTPGRARASRWSKSQHATADVAELFDERFLVHLEWCARRRPSKPGHDGGGFDDSGVARFQLHEQGELARDQISPVWLLLQYLVDARVEDHDRGE